MKASGKGKRWHVLMLILALVAWAALPEVAADAKEITISSLAELAELAGQSGNRVTMKPGVYRMIDFIPLATVRERRERNQLAFLQFSGNDNQFILRDVTIEFDTALRARLAPPIHTDEFVVSGQNNSIAGLTITNIGDGISHGGAVLGIAGDGTVLEDMTLHVQGSSPYGYGDLFGKGGYKHSGVHITASRCRFLGCRVFTKAFGHAFYIQETAGQLTFERCHAEGVMRATDEMLAETKGMAFDRQFRTELKNRDGQMVITPGYMKALSEDGFRTYEANADVVFRDCTVKHMRGGFELRHAVNARIENCTTQGTERGFWVGSGGTIVNSRGDTQYGPLLFVEGDRASVELTLVPRQSTAKVHALATIHGTGHRITIKPADNSQQNVPQHESPLPIMIGYGQPAAGDGAAPIPERLARDVELRNETALPVMLSPQTRKCQVTTRGPVTLNAGKENVIQQLADAPASDNR